MSAEYYENFGSFDVAQYRFQLAGLKTKILKEKVLLHGFFCALAAAAGQRVPTMRYVKVTSENMERNAVSGYWSV